MGFTKIQKAAASFRLSVGEFRFFLLKKCKKLWISISVLPFEATAIKISTPCVFLPDFYLIKFDGMSSFSVFIDTNLQQFSQDS